MKIFVALCLALITVVTANGAGSLLKPFKDDLFAYPKILDRSQDGSFLRVEYNRNRDLVNRDQILRRKAHFKYVDQGVRWSRSVRSFRSPSGEKKYFVVNKAGRDTRLAVIYIHGKGGNRRQGVNDWTFGGNFNRLQNLMVRNGGALFTPDFSDFKERGTADIASLIGVVRQSMPNARIVVACGSMGGGVCWRLVSNQYTARLLSGIFILGSHWYDGFLQSNVVTASTPNVPIYIGHGSKDPVFSSDVQLEFFRKIQAQNRNYPVRFVMFDTGAHGTPIRMVDWRRELNWMMSIR